MTDSGSPEKYGNTHRRPLHLVMHAQVQARSCYFYYTGSAALLTSDGRQEHSHKEGTRAGLLFLDLGEIRVDGSSFVGKACEKVFSKIGCDVESNATSDGDVKCLVGKL